MGLFQYLSSLRIPCHSHPFRSLVIPIHSDLLSFHPILYIPSHSFSSSIPSSSLPMFSQPSPSLSSPSIPYSSPSLPFFPTPSPDSSLQILSHSLFHIFPIHSYLLLFLISSRYFPSLFVTSRSFYPFHLFSSRSVLVIPSHPIPSRPITQPNFGIGGL